MSSLSAVYVKVDDGICTGRGLKTLCVKLNQRGYDIPGTEFEVFTFYEETWYTRIKCVGDGAWIKFVPEHWESAYKPKGDPVPQIRRSEE